MKEKCLAIQIQVWVSIRKATVNPTLDLGSTKGPDDGDDDDGRSGELHLGVLFLRLLRARVSYGLES